jgi:O-antigen ligase
VNTSEWLIPGIGLPQTSSVFEDSNYFGVVALVGFLASLYVFRARQRRRISYLGASLLTALNALGVFLSYSRSAYVALSVGVLIWFLVDARSDRKILILLAAGLAVIGARALLREQSSLRAFAQIDKGLSGREYLFRAALQAVAERPILGWGVGNVHEAIQRSLRWPQGGDDFAAHLFRQGIAQQWVSAHNGFLDYFIMTGIPVGLTYSWFILLSAARLWFSSRRNLERRFLLSATAAMLVGSQFITHTVGGISFGSFLFTLLLGMANWWPMAPQGDQRSERQLGAP